MFLFKEGIVSACPPKLAVHCSFGHFPRFLGISNSITSNFPPLLICHSLLLTRTLTTLNPHTFHRIIAATHSKYLRWIINDLVDFWMFLFTFSCDDYSCNSFFSFHWALISRLFEHLVLPFFSWNYRFHYFIISSTVIRWEILILATMIDNGIIYNLDQE